MYGLCRIRLPAQIASCTARGASAGAYATPWMIFATNPGTDGCDGGTTRGLTPAPPEFALVAGWLVVLALVVTPAPPPAADAAGAPASASTATLGSRRFETRKSFSFVGLRG